MKILLITDSFLPSLGGVERHVYTLSNYLADNEFKVSILTEKNITDDEPLEKKGIKVIRSMDLKKRDADYKWPYTRIYNSFKITDNINHYGNEYDLVHYHGTHSLYMDSLELDVPVINTIHGIFPVCIANWGVDQWCGNSPSMLGCAFCTAKIKRRYLSLMPAMMLFSGYYYNRMKSSLKSLDKIIAVSRYVGDIVKKGLELNNLLNIYNFIDIKNDIKKNINKLNRSNNILDVDSRNKIILFSGRLVESKGIHILIKSFQEIQEKIDNVNLVITGNGELKSYVEEVSSKNDKISYLGYIPREKQLKILKDSSVFAAPSTYPDACPTSIIESMALGVPVVSTNLGGIPELILDGETGHLVNPNDPGALAQKILDVLIDGGDKYHDKCVQRANMFDISTIGPRITELYSDLVYNSEKKHKT